MADPKAASTSEHYRQKSAASGSNVNRLKVVALIALNDPPCGACRGFGRTKYQPRGENKELGERTCESCYGSGKEPCGPDQRLKAAAELGQYIAPKRKAIEVNGEIQLSMSALAERLRK